MYNHHHSATAWTLESCTDPITQSLGNKQHFQWTEKPP